MKKVITAVVFILISVLFVSAQKKDKSMDKSMDDSLMKLEKQAWDAFGKGDGKFFESFATDDFHMIDGNGITGKADLVKMINTKPCDLKSYSLSNFKMMMLDKDAVIVTYDAAQEGDCGGMEIPSKVSASSVYVKRNGKWLAAFHQETPMMEMPE